jgi:hypothetical protein
LPYSETQRIQALAGEVAHGPTEMPEQYWEMYSQIALTVLALVRWPADILAFALSGERHPRRDRARVLLRIWLLTMAQKTQTIESQSIFRLMEAGS